MKPWIQRFYRRWFPTKEELYENGWDFAKQKLGDRPTEFEVDRFYDKLSLEYHKPFDRGIRDYCRSINWGKN